MDKDKLTKEDFINLVNEMLGIIYDKKNNLFIGDMANSLVLFKYNGIINSLIY